MASLPIKAEGIMATRLRADKVPSLKETWYHALRKSHHPTGVVGFVP